MLGLPARRARAVLLAVLAAALLVSIGAPAQAGLTWPAQLTAVPGPVRTIDPHFFGLNGARIISKDNAAEWHDPVFTQAVTALSPGFIRVQGGTTSQWLDWRTGMFDQSPDSPYVGANAGRQPILMSDWADLLRATGAQPVYDLNVVTSTPADQVAMLHAAQDLGMPVKYVELGNELYIGDKTYKKLYPTGADYALAMNHWIDVLRGAFPGLRIAVSAADTSSTLFAGFYGKRYTSWNDLLYADIRGADAVALHPYWFPTPLDGATSSAGSGEAAWQSFSTKVLDKIPAGLTAWLTEYNQMDIPFTEIGVPSGAIPGAKQTWAVGLSLASFSLQALTDPRIELAIVHAPLNGEPTAEATQSGGNMEVEALLADGSGGSVPFGRTAENYAVTPLFDAVRNQGSGPLAVRSLTASAAPPALSTLWSPFGLKAVDGVTGAVIGDRVVLLNLTSAAVRIAVPGTEGGQMTVLAAAPSTRPAFHPGDTIGSTSTTVGSTVLLPAYAEAVIAAP
jgi:hypothetical protein